MSVTVDIWTDINCPFCYLGKKRFLDALDAVSYTHLTLPTSDLV